MNMLTKLCLCAAAALAMAQPGFAQDQTATDMATGAAAAADAAPLKADLSPDTVVAVVNGEKITVGNMALARASLDKKYDQIPPDQLYPALREQLIRQALLEQSLKAMPPQLDYLLQNQRRRAMASEAVGQIADEAVTDEAVKQAYEHDYATAEPSKEYNASHILLGTKEEAEAALKRAQAGEDFGDLARELSTGPTGKNGGDLGWFTADRMVKPFSDAVVAMKPGDVVGPVQTQFGWHIIKLNDVRDQAAPKLDDVRAQIEQQLRQEAAQKAVNDLEASAKIEKTDNLDPTAVLDGSAFTSQ